MFFTKAKPSLTFEQRRAAIKPTQEHLGLDPSTAKALGGAGLALHNIDTRRGMGEGKETLEFYHAYDIDLLVPLEDFHDLRQRHPVRQKHPGLTYRWDIPARRGRPAVQALIDSWGVHEFFDPVEWAYREPPEVVHIDGCGTFSPDVLAHLKNRRGSPRDVVGLTMGHVSAVEAGNPIADDAGWLREIRRAVSRINTPDTRNSLEQARDVLPPEFTQLLDGRVGHPALREMVQLV